MADNSSVSSSSDSDDDFLTDGKSSTDREALVRKKLLQNFYGTSAVPSADSLETDDDDDYEEGSKLEASKGDKDDLDAPSFDAAAHTRRHVLNSSSHTLLETEEKLALQVRTLDSTMQTLVYENYSRFIDATDAIKSIGVNVNANKEGLEKLGERMTNLDRQSQTIEQAVGSLRDQVAEKIRIQRLLTRLDALLKLPKTLRELIQAGNYRKAAKNYLATSSILRQHSEGFESLKSIETECTSILEMMERVVKTKLLHWSGRMTSGDDESDVGTSRPMQPAQNAAEIFECAGTLALLRSDDGGFQEEEIRSLSLAASMRLLDRLLDAHMIEVQERRYNIPLLDSSATNLGASMSSLQPHLETEGVSLIPGQVLEGILEVATFFSANFKGEAAVDDLRDFVSETFSSFMAQVRAVLLDESVVESTGKGGDEGFDLSQERVSLALTILISAVRDLASSLPDLKLGVDFASSLVDQVMDLTENMIRRRVAQKFLRLRENVARSCLAPFATEVVFERTEAIASGKPALRSIVQVGSRALSNCLQFADDTIRSIFAGPGESSSSADAPILKDAVEASTYEFAKWLAGTFEVLAGGESNDPMHIVEAPIAVDLIVDETNGLGSANPARRASVRHIDFGDISREAPKVLECIENAHKELANADGKHDTVHADFVLGIAEVCRLAQGSVADNLKQSIATHGGGSLKKKQRGLFPTGIASADGDGGKDTDDDVSSHFQMASSRLIVLFACSRGSEMVELLCSELPIIACGDVEDPTRPRTVVYDALSIVKETCLTCKALYGGRKRGGPVPSAEVDAHRLSTITSGLSRKTGVQLDIERMFQERVTIVPHPSETIDASRNGVVFLALKVAFRGLLENVRLCQLSPSFFRQLQLEVEFMKAMATHYIDADYGVHGSNAWGSLSSLLEDVLRNAGERCDDPMLTDDDDVRHETRMAVRILLTHLVKSEKAAKIVVDED